MKITISKRVSEVIDVPAYFKEGDTFYKTLPNEKLLVAHKVGINIWSSPLSTENITESTEEEFLTAYHKAADMLMEKLKEKQNWKIS